MQQVQKYAPKGVDKHTSSHVNSTQRNCSNAFVESIEDDFNSRKNEELENVALS